MAPLPGVISQLSRARLITVQLSSGRLSTVDHFHHGRGNTFLLEETLTLDMGLSSRNAMLLLKLSHVDL